MGAHPGDPSHVVGPDGTERSLLELVEADPMGQLGERCAKRWGGRLPFLLKILAAEEPLSMQAHPSAAQAAEGHAREEQLGIPRDAPNRNYPDPTAKPELVCALTEFHALAGFRAPDRTVKLLKAIETPGLAKYTGLLEAEPDPSGLRALFTTWITLPQASLDELLPEVIDSCVRHVAERGLEEAFVRADRNAADYSREIRSTCGDRLFDFSSARIPNTNRPAFGADEPHDIQPIGNRRRGKETFGAVRGQVPPRNSIGRQRVSIFEGLTVPERNFNRCAVHKARRILVARGRQRFSVLMTLSIRESGV